jgi:hypothetical protein
VLRLLTKVTDDDTIAADNLLGNAILVDLAETNPLTKLVGIGDFEELDLVLGTEGLDETEVLFLLAGLGEDTKMGLAAVKSLDTLAETTGETVVVERATKDLDQGSLGGDLTNNGGDSFLNNNNISFC